MAAPLPTVAFPTVYAAEFGYVWNALRRLGVDDRDIEDLCHDRLQGNRRRRSGRHHGS
jgi:hypothetical protein